MVSAKDNSMGRFSVEVELANYQDVLAEKIGAASPGKVRRERARGVVDSGAARLVIPQSIATRLGLDISGTVQVRYADGRTATRQIARDVQLKYGNREGTFNAVIEPSRESVLVGAIVMEDLDLIIDCTTQRLVPRDPNQIISEIE